MLGHYLSGYLILGKQPVLQVFLQGRDYFLVTLLLLMIIIITDYTSPIVPIINVARRWEPGLNAYLVESYMTEARQKQLPVGFFAPVLFGPVCWLEVTRLKAFPAHFLPLASCPLYGPQAVSRVCSVVCKKRIAELILFC